MDCRIQLNHRHQIIIILVLCSLFPLISMKTATTNTKNQNSIDDKNQNSKNQPKPERPEWILVDDLHFNNFVHKSRNFFWYHSNWLVDDEPENLCSGMNIYQYSCHRKENVYVNKEGYLEIIATVNEHAKTGYERRFLFNTAKIVSNHSWLYGRFEMKAILPEGRSLRSVFMLQPSEPRYQGDWLDNGQINGLVYAQQHSAIIAGIHYKMSANQSYMGRKLYTQRNITKTFNRYTIEWSKHSIRWMFNDFTFFIHNVSKPFDQKFKLVLQLGVGGPEFDSRKDGILTREDAKHWVNNRFTIDYIKVYQQQEQIRPGSSSNTNKHIQLTFILIMIINCLYLS